jgi:hypothetical protein
MDTGATGHFFKVSMDLDNIMPTSENTHINVSLPDGTIITITHTGNLRIPGIPLSVQQAHVFPHLTSHSLLSISQLCAHGCKSIFTDTDVTITLNDTVILTGTRSTTTGALWTLTTITPSAIPISHLPDNAVNSSVHAMFHTTLAHDTIANRIAFYHATCFPPFYRRGAPPLMLATLPHGLASNLLQLKSTHHHPWPCTKATSIKPA